MTQNKSLQVLLATTNTLQLQIGQPTINKLHPTTPKQRAKRQMELFPRPVAVTERKRQMGQVGAGVEDGGQAVEGAGAG